MAFAIAMASTILKRVPPPGLVRHMLDDDRFVIAADDQGIGERDAEEVAGEVVEDSRARAAEAVTWKIRRVRPRWETIRPGRFRGSAVALNLPRTNFASVLIGIGTSGPWVECKSLSPNVPHGERRHGTADVTVSLACPMIAAAPACINTEELSRRFSCFRTCANPVSRDPGPPDPTLGEAVPSNRSLCFRLEC